MSSSARSLFVAIDGAAPAQLIENPAAVGKAHEVEQVPLVDRAIGGLLTIEHGFNLGTQLHHAVLRGCRTGDGVTVRIISVDTCPVDICARKFENFLRQ